ncbi:hypothetical protein B0H11DRAFT_1989903, partial [Mycena galericulata]
MAFNSISFPAGFFDIPSTNPPSTSSSMVTAPDETQSPSPTATISTRYTPLHARAPPSARPSLTPLHIPPSFTSTMRTSGTPDSGYNSSFSISHSTPSLSPTISRFQDGQPSPLSPLDQRGHNPPPRTPVVPELRSVSPSNEEGDESDTEKLDRRAYLLALYKAGRLVAEVGEGHPSSLFWRLQCNHCTKWVPTSIPSRTKLCVSGHFSALATHQSGKKCSYSKNFVRAKTAPPEPMRPAEIPDPNAMDVDEDDFDFQHGRSSSLPPEDTSAQPAHQQNAPSPAFRLSAPAPIPTAAIHRNLATEQRSCPGVVVDWNIEAGSAGWTFPWHRVIQKGAGDSQTEFFRIEIDSSEVTRAFSKECCGTTTTDVPCTECGKIPRRLLELEDLATYTKPHTNYRFLNYQQLTQLLTDKDSELRRWRLKVLAESDYPRLTQLLSAGLRNGASPRKLINLLGDVVEGLVKYTPRPSTDSRTLDIGLMSYVLGGRKLLYALSHGIGLPSLRTLRRYMAFTRIMPNIGTINLPDIIHNIEQVVLKPREAAGRTKLRGVSLLIDETALEERAVHFRHNNRVGGVCWRHSSSVNLLLNTYDSALKLANDIKGGKAHLAKEMTVVAATCFGESGTYPILALPACKHMTAEDSTTIYQVVTKAWKMHAASQVGILWSWATDGDMMRRVAGYKEFLAHKLPSTSAIHGTLAAMVGLNLWTGPDEVTLDFDFKHIFKRICTLLRSVQGIVLNNGHVINPAMLARYLLRLPNQTPESINQMLFPHDPQHVAHAVDLLQAVIALGELDYGNMDADTCADVDALRLLGEVIKAVLEPFVNTSMSLTEQITSLSTFAHLSFTLFRVSRTQYMSNQLYGDSQTMVKNAMFCLAKQTQLDPTQPFYLFQVGDDPLERLFGKLRMLGGHNSAMNYSQAIDRLGHAVDLQGAFMRNPDLDQGERRLNMSRSEGVDHLTMKSFTGNLIAGLCHQPGAWDDGRNIAIGILKNSAVAPEEYDYAKIFADGETDMLAPFGNGLYPGVDTSEEDRSMVATSTPTPSKDVEMPDSTEDPESGDDEGDGITFEESIDPEAVPELQLPSGPGITPEDYLCVDGKWVHKQRICRLVISKDFEPKSIVRLLRVRGYTNVNAKPRDDTHIDPSTLLGKDNFIVSDPILTLLRTDTKVSVAVLRTTAIHQDGVSRSSILATTIKNPAAKVKITVQVYSLTLIRKTTAPDFVGPVQTSAIIRAKDWLESDEESEWAWIWNGEYLKVDSIMRGTSGANKVATDKVVLVSVPGCLTELVNPSMVDAEIRLGVQTASRINSLGQSWEIDDKQMGLVAELLWGQAIENKVTADSITAVKLSETFPYVFDDGNPALLSVVPSQQLTQAHGERLNRVCELCGEKAENQRAHMGMHILRKLRGVVEKLIKPVGDALPCGFWGESGNAACNIYLHVKTKAATIETNCRLAMPVKYAYAERGSRATPCRNVPIVCSLFPSTLTAGKESRAQPAVWRYNMAEHLAQVHPEYASPRNPDGLQRLPNAVWTSMAMAEGEEVALGIPLGKIPAPFTRVAGPDEGADEPEQMGVRKVPVRTEPPQKKKRKGNSGTAVVASGSRSK